MMLAKMYKPLSYSMTKTGVTKPIDPADSQKIGMEIKLPATISHVVWSKPEDNFAIFSVFINRKSCHYLASNYPKDWVLTGKTIVKCNLFDEFSSIEGKPIVLVGKTESHPKYGMQMAAGFFFIDQPASNDGMLDYLQTLPHVGASRAKLILEAFKAEEIGDIIENRQQNIVALKIGLTPDRTILMREQWIKDKAMRQVYLWLGDHGVGLDIGAKVVKKWGAESINVITSDPYLLTQIRGIGFKIADAIAFKVLEQVPPDKRTDSCVRHVIKEALNSNGHICLPFENLKKATLSLLQINSGTHDYDPEVRASVDRGVLTGCLKTMVVPFGNGQTEMVYNTEIWDMEREIASGMLALGSQSSGRVVSDQELQSSEEEISKFMGLQVNLNETQRAGVISAFANRLTVITGSGGTGKSTICRCICDIAKCKGLSIRQMTPTGKAAKVMKTKTSQDAQTIHRSLGLVPGMEIIDPHPIGEDIVIVDEFSMCGLDTVYAIVLALAGNSDVHLVLVGDHQQLPSVSPGNFLWDIIKSGIANVVKLDKIYRQDEHSYITVVADNIAKGLHARVPKDADDIRVRKIDDTSAIPAMVCEIISRSMKERGIAIDDIHAMASMYRGDCGVDAINSAIQEMVAGMNGAPSFVATQFKRFYVGDRVMHCENDYEKNVFNGDMGVCVEVGRKIFDKDRSTVPEPYIVVSYDDERPSVCYKRDDFDTVKVAWCTTVHKYQGSQCKYVVFVAPRDHKHMLSRELVYTAITRAEKKVIILANQSELDGCVKKSIAGVRYTTLIHQVAVIKQELRASVGNEDTEGMGHGNSGNVRHTNGNICEV